MFTRTKETRGTLISPKKEQNDCFHDKPMSNVAEWGINSIAFPHLHTDAEVVYAPLIESSTFKEFADTVQQQMHNKSCSLKYHEAALLLTITVLTVQFTDMMNDNHDHRGNHSLLSWTTFFLCISSISPWNIPRLIKLFGPVSFFFTAPSKAHRSQRNSASVVVSSSLTTSQKQFAVFELIHDIAGFGYHVAFMPTFVWMAIINFPMMFAHIDRVMLKKERPLTTKDKVLCSQSPLVLFSFLVYIIGVALRGDRFILSGSGIIALSLPLTRRNVSISVAIDAVPLGILFLLEHYSILHQMDLFHNVIHTISHFAIHKAKNDMFIYICS